MKKIILLLVIIVIAYWWYVYLNKDAFKDIKSNNITIKNIDSFFREGFLWIWKNTNDTI